MILNFFRGFCMALADSVPGISGGTIAFILGFYNKFIDSLNGILSKNTKIRKESIVFLLKLSLGWLVGIVGSLIFISTIFEKHIYQISSLFIGLILFSVPIIIREEKKYIIGKQKNIIFSLISLSIVVLISFISENLVTNINILDGSYSIALLLYIFASGAIAISSMILPGISGSTILVILGLYGPILMIIKEIAKGNLNHIYILLVFVIGIICGVLLSVRIIKSLLDNYRTQAIYSILGLMIGSVYTLVEGPKSLSIPKEAISIETFSIVYFILGGIIILILQWVKLYIERLDK
ncbi:DUF368 domain-containing protein [Clostridium sp.]|uniref:DUF368 domain-containing protein n=1 Tax=Clostridium sp. TaxID=1506 RepID=UPI002FCB1011